MVDICISDAPLDHQTALCYYSTDINNESYFIGRSQE